MGTLKELEEENISSEKQTNVIKHTRKHALVCTFITDLFMPTPLGVKSGLEAILGPT